MRIWRRETGVLSTLEQAPAAARDAGLLGGGAAFEASVFSLQLSPHDLRRTCAKLCRLSGGALEQIQFLLGHASVQTTERYLGVKQDLQVAVNDKPGVGPRPA